MLEIDFNSPEWAALKDWGQRRLEKELSVLKNPSSTHEQTQFVRGRISALEEMLSLPESSKALLSEVLASY
jgi:hypothetical protein